MKLSLIGNIFLNSFCTRRTHRKCAVTALPLEVMKFFAFGFYPFGTAFFSQGVALSYITARLWRFLKLNHFFLFEGFKTCFG